MEENMSCVQTEETPRGGKFGVVRTGAFYGLSVLFAIPVIGWIAAVLFIFLHKNKNIKHFAGSSLIRSAVALVTVIALIFAGIAALNEFVPGLKEAGGVVQAVGTVRVAKKTMDQFQEAGGDLEELAEIYEETGDIDEVIDEIEDRGVDPEPLLDKLGGKDEAVEAIENFKEDGTLPYGISMDMIEQYIK